MPKAEIMNEMHNIGCTFSCGWLDPAMLTKFDAIGVAGEDVL